MVLILTARLSKKLPTLYFHIPLFLVNITIDTLEMAQSRKAGLSHGERKTSKT